MNQFTHMGRPIDPRYPTNLAILIWTAAVAVIVFGVQLVSGMAFIDAGIHAIVSSLAVIVTWIIAREIDPQEQLSAFVGVALMTVAVFIVDVRFNLIVLFYIVSMSRIVNRSVGLPATIGDSLVLLVFTGVVGFLGSWIYAMMGAAAFWLDSILPDRDRKHLLFAGLSLVVMVVAFMVQNSGLTPVLPTTEFNIVIIGVTIIFIPVVLKSRELTVTADITGETLISIRVQSTQMIALLFGYHVALWQGDAGVLELLPLWIALAGIAVFPLVKLFLPDWDLSPRN